MIISGIVIDLRNNNKLYRSSFPLSSAKMTYYVTEFVSIANETEGFIEKDTYNYIYTSTPDYRIALQVSKDHSVTKATKMLKFIEQNSSSDIFDLLVVIDNCVFGGIGIPMEMQPILEMDSQEEKIHKMMLENKKKEMMQKEKEYSKSAASYVDTSAMSTRVTAPVEVAVKKIEKSSKPILLIIKEKIKIEIDKENNVKDNTVNGEIDMVITDAKYKQLQIKMKNLKPSLKFSPYLDKSALKKQILRFEKERGLNKNIPLLKWAGKTANIPVSCDIWIDEDDGMVVNLFEFKAAKNLKNVELRFNNENVNEFQTEEEYILEDDQIVYQLGNMDKDESKTVEIKCNASKDALFPISITFTSDTLDTNIDVEKMFVEDEEVTEYEVRKIVDVEQFNVNYE